MTNIIDRTATGAVNAAEAWPALPAAAMGLGGWFLGKKLSNNFDDPSNYEGMAPEDIQRAIRRRKRLWGALGAAAGFAVPTYFMGDFSGFREGKGEGLRRFFSRMAIPGANITPGARKDRDESMMDDKQGVAPTLPMTVPIPSGKQKTSSLEKLAGTLGSNFFTAPTIPMNGMIQVVADDPWLHPGQKTGLISLLAATGQKTDAPLFSGMDLARTAVRAGAGAAEGWALGRVMGAVSMLPPSTVSSMSRTGAVAGAFLNTGVIGF